MISRRQLIKLSALASIGSGLGLKSFTQPFTTGKKRILRFAHLTDVHLEPELRAPEGLAQCLHHLQSQQDQPSFIMSGGDSIFDALHQPKDRVELQWNLWNNIFKQDNSLPIEYTIGNHDCWGMGEKSDPLYGKKYAMEKMLLTSPYRSFDKAGWHFIVLDSIQPKADGSWYTCYLDDEQFNWLEKDLQSMPASTPVIVVSHAPIMSAAAVVTDNKFKENEGYVISGGIMHSDAPKIIALFDKHPNVKLCLSGHIHLYEKLQYNGVTYLCNGAVSGNWWKGIRYKTDNGYALINLYDDGSFDNEYVTYGFKV